MCKAIIENNVPNIQRIFKAKYPVDEPVTSNSGTTPLMHVSAEGKVECLQEILSRGPDFTLRDRAGRTALHYACKGGKMENLKMLLAAMPKEAFQMVKEARTVGGVTPLMYAVQSGNIHVVGECLNSGFNPYCKDDLG